MVSQFPSLKNFKILNKLIITKGEEQQAVVKSIREHDFFCVTYCADDRRRVRLYCMFIIFLSTKKIKIK